MLAGFILACGNGMLRPSRGRYRSSPSDEYDARVPRAFRREELKSVVHLIACAERRCSARSHAADGLTSSLGS